jgi:hypothetical protein
LLLTSRWPRSFGSPNESLKPPITSEIRPAINVDFKRLLGSRHRNANDAVTVAPFNLAREICAIFRELENPGHPIVNKPGDAEFRALTSRPAFAA